MILGISLHLGMTTQTAVSICDLDLYFTVHCLCKFEWRDIAFDGILELYQDHNIWFHGVIIKILIIFIIMYSTCLELWLSGPSCSKLTMLLVNIWLKL